jgi:hypothetical protein
MIFSFSDSPSAIVIPPNDQHVFLCFFYHPQAIHAPMESWFTVLLTCLRQKKNVLILQDYLWEIPLINTTKAWQVGDNYLWLSPRALNLLFSTYPKISPNLVQMKLFLTTYKPSKIKQN